MRIKEGVTRGSEEESNAVRKGKKWNINTIVPADAQVCVCEAVDGMNI